MFPHESNFLESSKLPLRRDKQLTTEERNKDRNGYKNEGYDWRVLSQNELSDMIVS